MQGVRRERFRRWHQRCRRSPRSWGCRRGRRFESADHHSRWRGRWRRSLWRWWRWRGCRRGGRRGRRWWLQFWSHRHGFETGVRTGNRLVTITYEPSAERCPSPPSRGMTPALGTGPGGLQRDGARGHREGAQLRRLRLRPVGFSEVIEALPVGLHPGLHTSDSLSVGGLSQGVDPPTGTT